MKKLIILSALIGLASFGCIGFKRAELTKDPFHTYTPKTAPTVSDVALIADQEAANAIKTVTLDSLPISSDTQAEIDTKEDTLVNEAGLYSALSDVSNFAQSVGDCTSSAAFDGTPDGGTAFAIYDGTANKLTFNVPTLGADRIFNFPANAPFANGILGINAGNTALEYKSSLEVTVSGGTASTVAYWSASGNLGAAATTAAELALLEGETSSLMNDSDWIAATTIAAGKSELATIAEVNTGTSADRTVTPYALSGSNLGAKEAAWVIYDRDVATAVADGKQAFPVSGSMATMVLVDLLCRVDDLNDAESGETTVVLRRVRVGSRMGDDTSQFDLTDQTGDVARVTWDGTGTDPGVSTSTLSVGDHVDMSGWTDAGNNGNFTLSAVATNYFEYTNASLVADSDQTTMTLTPTRHRDMTSTGVTVGYGEYFAADEVVDTSNDELVEGDGLYIDVTAITTAAQKGLSAIAVFQLP